MHKALVVAALLAASAAVAAAITITGTPKTFTDCAAGGSVAQTLTAGSTLLRTTTETVWLCFAASASTCASGGEAFPAGTVMLIDLRSDQVSVSCRSAGATGDAYLTLAM